MTDILRTPGQSPIFPGVVAHDGLILTSGVIHPALIEPTNPVPGFREQASVALDEVLRYVSDAGGSPENGAQGRRLPVQARARDHLERSLHRGLARTRPGSPDPGHRIRVPGLEIEIQAVAARN